MSKLFHKYGSLVNHYVEKFINIMMMAGEDRGIWVALEKIHGANFSFWTDGSVLWTAKRSGVIGDGKSFFSSHKLEKYNPKVLEVYQGLVESGIVENGDVMAIYGEIFGGHFFGEQEPDSKRVQGGMNYHPGTEFSAYDIIVYPLDGEDYILSYLEFLEAIGENLPVCPEVGRGEFYDVLKLNNNFPSLVPAMFGLKAPDGEHLQSEGFVMRPVDGERFVKGGRCILKSKNSKFSERGGKATNAGATAEAMKMTDEENALYLEFSVYFNQSRLESVLSKYNDELSWEDFGPISGLLVVDAIEDFERDKDITLKGGDFWNKARKHIGKLSGEVVRDHLKRVC